MALKHITTTRSRALDEYQVLLAQDGDKRAFELLYKRWHPKLYKFAYRLIGDRDGAQDVMQDAALTIAKNIDRLNDPKTFSSWAYVIVRRRSADYISRAVKARRVKSELENRPEPAEAIGPDDSLSLKQALARLSETDRSILDLFYRDGMTGPEIASALGIPIGTVKSRLYAAREKLKSIYDINLKGD